MLSDKILIKKVKANNEIAFEQLFDRYYQKAYYFALRYLKNREDAEGLVQEVFIKVWMNRHRLNPEQSFNAYLFTIARNAIFNIHRSRQYERAYQEFAAYMGDYVDNRSENEVVYSDLLDYLNKIVAQLPPKRQHIYRMSREQGLTYKEIAREMNVSEKTVETHLRLALQTIKKELRSQMHLPVLLIAFLLHPLY